MRRALLVLGAILTLVLGTSAVSSVARAASLYTFAVGGGFAPCQANIGGFMDGGTTQPGGICFGGPNGEHFAFSAHQTVGDASTLTGHVVLWFVDESGHKTLTLSGHVTCFTAASSGTGGTANITFQVDNTPAAPTPPSGFPAAPGQGDHVTFSVVDTGQPNSPPPDTISPAQNSGPAVCGTALASVEPVNLGNISVSLQDSNPAVPMSSTDPLVSWSIDPTGALTATL